jgi:hypothetical protein
MYQDEHDFNLYIYIMIKMKNLIKTKDIIEKNNGK